MPRTSTSWKPGTSGNAAGRKAAKTGRNALRASIGKDAGEIVKKMAELAKAGDVQAAKVLLDRILPPIKPEAAPVVLPAVAAALTPTEQAQMVIQAAARGELAPDIAAQLLAGLGQAARVRESDELAREIEELKKRIGT